MADKSIREELSEALKAEEESVAAAEQSEDEPTAGDEQEIQEAPEPEEEPTGGEENQSDADEAEPSEETEEQKSDESGEPKKGEPEESEDEGSPLVAPQSWKDEEKAEFAKLPRAVQNTLLRRESERERHLGKKSEELAEQRKRYAAMDEVFEPLRPALAREGIDEAALIKQYLAIDQSLSRDPSGTIQWLANRAGVDLSALGHQSEGVDQEDDPRYAELNQKLNALQQQLVTKDREARSAAEQQNAQVRQELETQIDTFRNASDDQGNLMYPYFDEVRQHMGHLMATGAAETMEDAYGKAVRLPDDLYESHIEAERRKARKAAEEESRKRAAEAKAKNVSVKGSPGGQTAKRSAGSVREELERAFNARA